jgi:hypothetical protein
LEYREGGEARSKNILGTEQAGIFQADQTEVVDGDLVTVFVWYDNEFGYANRLVDLVTLINKTEAVDIQDGIRKRERPPSIESLVKEMQADLQKQVKADNAQSYGGINLDPAMLNMEIKRDGKGIVLPANQQPIFNMNLDGLMPVIINVTPANMAMLLGLNEPGVMDRQAGLRHGLLNPNGAGLDARPGLEAVGKESETES